MPARIFKASMVWFTVLVCSFMAASVTPSGGSRKASEPKPAPATGALPPVVNSAKEYSGPSAKTGVRKLSPAKADAIRTEKATGVSAELAEVGAEARAGRLDVSLHRRRGTRIEGDLVTISAVATRDGRRLLDDLRRLGLRDGASTDALVTGRLPVGALGRASELTSLRSMRQSIAVTRAGSVQSQGDAAIKADDARALGFNGAGVTVGTISDSYNCTGGAANDVASGDLPTGVVVLGEGPCASGTDEGRAMMQEIADVAPGAGQIFRTAANGLLDFAQGIKDLKAAGAKVVVDDFGYADEPWFQDGVIARAVDAVSSAGVSYFSAAGNSRRDSYESPFVSSGIVGATDPSSIAHDFDPGPATDVRQRIAVAAHSVALIVLQWVDNFRSQATGGPAPQSDLDLFAFTPGGALLDASATNNPATLEPIEWIAIDNSGSASQLPVDLEIDRFSGPDPTRMKWIDFYGSTSVTDFDTSSGTAVGHQAAAGAHAVGAAFYGATPEYGTSPPQLESFSSAGGTPIVFDPSGTRLSVPVVRQKPDVVAPDGVSTTMPAFTPFFGTSAAAPHAAGVAALMLQKAPGTPPASIGTWMSSTAVDMGTPGSDFDSGAGLVDAAAAVTATTATPHLSLAPATLSFGNANIGGSPTASKTVTASNSGNGSMHIATVALAGTGASQFKKVGDSCSGATLAQGASCIVNVSFAPTTAGSKSATVAVPSDSPEGTKTTALGGTGVDPVPTWCKTARYRVKTGADADRGLVKLSTYTKTTIDLLRSKAKPTTLPTNARLKPVEATQWWMAARLVMYKKLADGDIYVVVRNNAGRTMVIAFPSSYCAPSWSPMRSALTAARSTFAKHYTATSSWKSAGGRLVYVRGPGFFVKPGLTGSAPNGIELAPILALRFA